ncbi:dephospho-CoA kinase [Bifidobacterium sp. SMB2]|uniref:Dephospho-CoA kinase n=1 Tax=Bifidobacterium saimiriisciurei TaxID=2661627 RepID=A0ABX0C866_9BIFI|nr:MULTISPECIES: dephospho-CoA kinase [Bifidobacterium]NEG96137.1 dephospho-CoA kinase [Bifidobacterium sp. SMB2]NEH10785.1 dephospho-CoA kinase [Bifidobacterium saimiriisciurei]
MFTRVGLTGGIAAGKSTVASRFVDLGAYVIDYDKLARDAVRKGSEGLAQIIACFGRHARGRDGELNRQWMADHVFGDPGRLRELNRIVHPIVFREAGRLEYQWIDSHPEPKDGTRRLVIHDIPLLVETSRWDYFDAIITVEAPEETRIRRMVRNRGMTRAAAEARIRNQATQQQRFDISDYVIDSTKPIEQMFEDVDRLYRVLTHPSY